MFRRGILFSTSLISTILFNQALAGISLNATRVIFNEKDKEASLSVTNQGSQQILLQSWLETENSGDPVPFAITPPLARMAGNARQQLRVLFQGTGVPTDKESVFWINAQEIPQAAPGMNTLQLAVRQRIKLFYRPAGLASEAIMAPLALNWKLVREGNELFVQVDNPSHFHVSLAEVRVHANDQEARAQDAPMVAPGQSTRIALSPYSAASSMTLKFTAINDYGGTNHYKATLTANQVAQAQRE